MSLQTDPMSPIGTIRRGRPRKQPTVPVPIATTTTTTTTTTNNTESNISTPSTPVYDNDKPREERSYKDFFPNLDIRALLPIVRVADATPELVPCSSQENKASSPSIDEYETASESELPSKLPIASFEKMDLLQDIMDDQDDHEDDLEQHNPNDFYRPENHYIRYIEPSESELFNTIEYDMDEQGRKILWKTFYFSILNFLTCFTR
jgi:hypothetical protein